MSTTSTREWEHWNDQGVSETMDTYWRSSALEAEWRRILMADMLEVLPAPSPVLEIGCGSGVMYEAMVEAGVTTPELYRGGDISESMLQIARFNHPEGVMWDHMDVFELPFENKSQEVVLSISLLQHLPDYKRALAELLRITKKHLYVTTWFHEGPEDTIVFDGKYYENGYSLPLFNKSIGEGKFRVRQLYLANYSLFFSREERPRAYTSPGWATSPATYYEARLGLLRHAVPKLFKPSVGGTCLYVGASPTRTQLVSELSGYKITLLEAWPTNCEVLSKDPRFAKVICEDVRHVGKLPGKYDIVVWWQGPEHVEKEDLPGIFEALAKKAKKLVLLACPWGVNPQGPVGGNPFEVHRSSLDLEDFTSLGYEAVGIGTKDTFLSDIVAWRVL